MAVAVLFSEVFLQSLPNLFVLITQILCGAAVYIGLMMYSQRMLVTEIRDMIFNKGVTVAK